MNDTIYFAIELFIVLLVCVIAFISVVILDKKDYYDEIDQYKISPQNNIIFCKLRKQYLNKCSERDINDLIVFLERYKKERKKVK